MDASGSDMRAPPAPPPTVERVAEVIRQIYVAEYRRFRPSATNYGQEPIATWDGGDDRWGKTHTAIWPKIARLVVHRQLDPFVFIQIQFAKSVGGNPPPPTFLMGELALQRYQDYTRFLPDMLKREFARQASQLQLRIKELAFHGLNELQCAATAIVDTCHVDATSLFRYCMAVGAGLEQIAARFRDEALYQYAFQKDYYDSAWDVAVIPEVLRQDAAVLRQQLTY